MPKKELQNNHYISMGCRLASTPEHISYAEIALQNRMFFVRIGKRKESK
jgi:hypothetical protein